MFKKVLNIISTIVLIVLIIVVLFVFYTRATGGVPEIFGYQVYRVQTGSMTPTLEVGDIILSRRVDITEIHKGDIITYKGTQADFKDKLITHEVIVEPHQNSEGIYLLQTQGTVSGSNPDPEIYEAQVMGKYIVTLKFLNSLYTFFLSPFGLVTFILVIMVLFGYEMISLIVSYKAIDDKTEEMITLPKEDKKKKDKKKSKHG